MDHGELQRGIKHVCDQPQRFQAQSPFLNSLPAAPFWFSFISWLWVLWFYWWFILCVFVVLCVLLGFWGGGGGRQGIFL